MWLHSSVGRASHRYRGGQYHIIYLSSRVFPVAILQIEHATFLTHGRNAGSEHFAFLPYFQTNRRHWWKDLTMQVRYCEDKLNMEIANFCLPSVAQKRHLLYQFWRPSPKVCDVCLGFYISLKSCPKNFQKLPKKLLISRKSCSKVAFYQLKKISFHNWWK